MPLAALIPMTTLAAVLLIVAANMADWTSFFRLCKTAPKSDVIVLVATFLLTVFFDLVIAIEVGVVLAAMLFMKRMAETADVTAWKYLDEPDVTPGEAEKLRDIPHTIRVFEISGPLFFAAADQILQINSDKATRVIVIRMRSVPAIDASAMKSLRELYSTVQKRKDYTGFLPRQRTADVRNGQRWLYRVRRSPKFPCKYRRSSGLCRKSGKIVLFLLHLLYEHPPNCYNNSRKKASVHKMHRCLFYI